MPFFTIDTDNAVIRFYRRNLVMAGVLDEQTLLRIQSDLRTMALGMSHATHTRWTVETLA